MSLHEYEILEKMASGTFGIVFKVRRVTDHKLFVMKRIPLLDLSEDQRRDSVQEIAVMRDLHHPCVVEQKDAFLYNEHDLCFIMEYYDGGDMDTRVAAQRELDIYFSFEQVMLWFVQLVLGAQYLHAHHVIHRDIKSHNVFVRKQDSSVSLGDFGISESFNAEIASRTWAAATMNERKDVASTAGSGARDGGADAGGTPGNENAFANLQPASSSFAQYMEEAQRSTPQLSPYRLPESQQSAPLQQTMLKQRRSSSNADASSPFLGFPQSPWAGGRMEAAMKGTPLYMAPEVIQGGAASPKSDVWSLGCVLYELLTLRHPFESRDLATLVMRVSRGQREPLPVHYPRAIQEVINHMLHLDAAQRPTCEEVLTVPCVRAYVELWRALRAPLDVPTSLGETALAKQLTAWQANVKAAVLKNSTDPRYVSVHHSEIERQLMPPACTPSEEREATEKRTVEAARAALLNAGPSTSISSALSFSGAAAAGGSGVAEGTFFYGASGRHMAAELNGTGGGTGAAGCTADVSSFPYTATTSSGFAVSARGAAAGVAPTESMRPYMVYDSSPLSGPGLSQPRDSPMNAMPGGETPVRHTPGADKRGQQRKKQRQHNRRSTGQDDTSALSTPSPSPFHFPSLSSPTTPPRRGRRREKSRSNVESLDSDNGRRPGMRSPEPSAARAAFSNGPLPSKSPPPPLRGAILPSKAASRTADSAQLPSPPLDEEALFFKAHRNIIDMRYASMEDIADAVVQLRQRVQQLMRHHRVLLDVEQLLARHGSAPLQSMPNVLNVLATAAAASTDGEGAADQWRDAKGGRTGDSTGGSMPRSSSARLLSPEGAYAHMVQHISEERGGRQRQETMHEAWTNPQEAAGAHRGRGENAAPPVGRPSPTRIRQLREMVALAESEAVSSRLPRPQVERRLSASCAIPFADPTVPLRLPASTAAYGGEASQRQRWSVYIQRRNSLSDSLIRVFEPTSLRAVYAYYYSHPVLQRDTQLVRRLVPDRQLWAALPLVEELVVLDHRLEPLLEKAG
ncbi:putative protein kinase [Leptomonas seymouri]|uniref:Protein kinase domain-containing protein n=1 Tax=Leptomonas seymouri TaxID=5684 RepID=A0A0N0P7K7_LEPSE|nr:putative protein kinase [Leptomonas seymouri]|eukprot:KPI88467.1 putative protein kinase [Leptomonas seymouri]